MLYHLRDFNMALEFQLMFKLWMDRWFKSECWIMLVFTTNSLISVASRWESSPTMICWH